MNHVFATPSMVSWKKCIPSHSFMCHLESKEHTSRPQLQPEHPAGGCPEGAARRPDRGPNTATPMSGGGGALWHIENVLMLEMQWFGKKNYTQISDLRERFGFGPKGSVIWKQGFMSEGWKKGRATVRAMARRWEHKAMVQNLRHVLCERQI